MMAMIITFESVSGVAHPIDTPEQYEGRSHRNSPVKVVDSNGSSSRQKHKKSYDKEKDKEIVNGKETG